MRLPFAPLLTLALLPAAALAQQPSARWQALCEAQLPPTVIEVTAEPAPVRHRNDRSIADLMQVHRNLLKSESCKASCASRGA